MLLYPDHVPDIIYKSHQATYVLIGTVKRNVLANQTVYMMPDSHMLWGLFGIREYGLYAT